MTAKDRARVLVVDDEPALRRSLARGLLGAGFDVLTAEGGAAALGLLATARVDAVLLDLGMPGVGGLEALASIKAAHPDVEVVVMAAHAEMDAAIRAVRAGAHGFVTKPPDVEEAVILAVERAVERRRLAGRARALEERLGQHERFGEIVGASGAIGDVVAKAMGVATSSAPVLLLGEPGTGKELLARAIHRRSAREGRRFVPVGCAALPEVIVEAELFAPGGPMDDADRGTLFLDEVAALPPAAQARLAAALGAGGRREGPRIIAATAAELRERVAEGRFREDLYYRLAVVTLRLPPLRGRREDVPLLAHHFLERHARRHDRAIRRIGAEAMRLLRGHGWPGNVRELEGVIEHAVVMARGDAILPADLPPPLGPGAAEAEEGGARLAPALLELPYAEAKDRAVDAFDRAYVEHRLRRASGNLSEAARQAGLDRSNFRRLRKKVEGG